MEIDKNRFFKDKNVLVLGLGRSGLSVLDKLTPISKNLIAADDNKNFILPEEYSGLADNNKIKFFIGNTKDLEEDLLYRIDIIIVSPGVSMDLPLIKKAIRKKIEIWSELELAWHFMDAKQRENTIAVTGTNGKTTVTALIGKILQDYGLKTETCGNIGNPLLNTLQITGCLNNKKDASEIKKNEDDTIRVIEVSSFQLENSHLFNPHVAIILNITNDHIDRHKSMENYSRLKFKISGNQAKNDYLIVNCDDKHIAKYLNNINTMVKIKSRLIRVSLDDSKGTEIFHKKEQIIYDFLGLSGKVSIKGTNLIGLHNISNIMSAVGAVKIFNIDDLSISDSIRKFLPLPHRLEYCGEINEIRCFNDSKATNPDATIKALEYFKKEVTLILGGLDKGMNFRSLIPILNKKVLNLILIGSCKETLFNIFSETAHDYKIFKAITLDEAVDKAFKVTEKGNVFLLSPACASMDMFKDYKERGEQFKKLVLSINK
ncbi:MAG: UDP-N-acetylmuramoyl-L-alanine--D-glutamate ligase [Actinobacteria bacterium]|nr:UDP-N-acetylmuramoyl-L-alanine--D-glutamate ligase [Actinomycetota bacterium]